MTVFPRHLCWCGKEVPGRKSKARHQQNVWEGDVLWGGHQQRFYAQGWHMCQGGTGMDQVRPRISWPERNLPRKSSSHMLVSIFYAPTPLPRWQFWIFQHVPKMLTKPFCFLGNKCPHTILKPICLNICTFMSVYLYIYIHLHKHVCVNTQKRQRIIEKYQSLNFPAEIISIN